jgi:outer membrane protein assembly factor BamA
MNKTEILKTVKSDIEGEDIKFNNEDSDTENEGENIIIQNFSIGGDKRVEVSSMLSTLLAQREVDQKKFLTLNKKNNELEVENSKLDMKLHYMKLDLANAQIKAEELETVKKTLETVSKELQWKKSMLNVSVFIDLVFILILWMLF